VLFLKFIEVKSTIDVDQWYCVVCVDFVVVRTAVDIVQLYCVVCVVYCG